MVKRNGKGSVRGVDLVKGNIVLDGLNSGGSRGIALVIIQVCSGFGESG